VLPSYTLFTPVAFIVSDLAVMFAVVEAVVLKL
jgi:hypothetical protein